jgi:hypothetical protein
MSDLTSALLTLEMRELSGAINWQMFCEEGFEYWPISDCQLPIGCNRR